VNRLTVVGAGLLLAAAFACRWSPGGAIVDRDGDGLDDRVEARLARKYLPTLHEFADASNAGGRDACPWPTTRPILYRARPRLSNRQVDLENVAITYVLLYAEDCGALGHAGDDEAFTVFLHRGPGGVWQIGGAEAVAHRGTPVERRSIGSGQAIWISRNKHSPYATFEACGVDDWIVDVCAKDGPSPPGYMLLNVGEPSAPLSNDAGDVLLTGGADPYAARRLAPWLVERDDETARARLIDALRQPGVSSGDETNLAYLLFRGQAIWSHRQFLGAGDLTAQLSHGAVTLHLPQTLNWDAEDPAAWPATQR
jgi:hypothetical protein